MSWIFGAIGEGESRKGATAFSGIHPPPLHTIRTDELYIAIGGIPETAFCGIFPGDTSSGWMVSGLGIRREGDHCTMFDQTDWQAFLSAERPSVENIDGHFVALRWNAGRISIFTDQTGLRTLYLAKTSSGVLFSTRLSWLAAASGCTKIDYRAFGSQWLSFNQYSYDSFIHGIERIGPAGKAVCTPSSMHIESTPWTPDPSRADAEYLPEMLGAFANPSAADGRNIAMGLSGGFDSRVLLALLNRERDPELLTYTFGNAHDPDVIMAKRIAEQEQFAHRHFNDPLPPVEQCIPMLEEYAAWTCAIQSASSALRLRYYAMLHADRRIVLDGGFGEVGRRQYFLRLALKGSALLHGGAPEQLLPHLRRNRPEIFTPEIRNVLREGALDQLDSVFSSLRWLDGLGDDAFLALLYIRMRFPNFGGPEQARMDELVSSYMPLVQPSVLHALFALPQEERTNGRLYRRIIHQRRPSLERLPLVRGTVLLPFNVPTFAGSMFAALRTRVYRSFIDPLPEMVLRHVREYVLDLAHSDAVRTCPVYEYPSILSLVDGYYRGNKALCSSVDWWLAFELWRRGINKSNSLLR